MRFQNAAVLTSYISWSSVSVSFDNKDAVCSNLFSNPLKILVSNRLFPKDNFHMTSVQVMLSDCYNNQPL